MKKLKTINMWLEYLPAFGRRVRQLELDLNSQRSHGLEALFSMRYASRPNHRGSLLGNGKVVTFM